MRTSLALVLLLVACGGPKKKPATSLNDDTNIPSQCCCKFNAVGSVDGQPQWEMAGNMDCSTRHGDCVDEVQCQKAPTPEGPPAPQ